MSLTEEGTEELITREETVNTPYVSLETESLSSNGTAGSRHFKSSSTISDVCLNKKLGMSHPLLQSIFQFSVYAVGATLLILSIHFLLALMKHKYDCNHEYMKWYCVSNCVLLSNTTCSRSEQVGFDEVFQENLLFIIPSTLSMLGSSAILISFVRNKSLHVVTHIKVQPFS